MPSVWLVNHYAAFPDFPGPTRHFELARRLALRGFDVTVIASEFDSSKGIKFIEGEGTFHMVERDGVRFVWLRSDTEYSANDAMRVRNMIEFAWRLWREGRKLLRGSIPRPDVVLGSTPHLLTPLAAWLLARRFRVPFVMEVRDLWPETFVAFGVFKRWHPVVLGLRLLERFLYRRARRIVALLPEAWRYIEARGVTKDQVVWIPNGVTVDPMTADGDGGTGSPFTLMYVGAHGRANVLEDLVLAASRLQDRGAPVRIVFVGDGGEKSALMRSAEKLALSNVEFLGRVARNQVAEITRTADAFVALLEDTDLYRYGTSLNKVFDYMAEGKPVILAGRIARNYVDEAKCGLTVPPRDAEALADAIETLVELPEAECREMGERGRAYVREHHNWDLLVGRLAEALREAAGL